MMPSFRVEMNPVVNGFHVFRDRQEVTFISAEEVFKIRNSGALPLESNDIYKIIVALLRNMKVIKLHPSQYTIERINA